jgi:putative glutamine amidotransferase
VSGRLKIGISACFFHADPSRPIFTGKTLQYVEQSVVHWVQSTSRAIALVIPSPEGSTRRGDVELADYVELLDGFVLEGGSDLWPGSYGETPMQAAWSGDRVRDEYEIALTRAFVAAGKPVLGICRGLQLLNVAFGGTLYQDIGTQVPGSLVHREKQLYDQNFHEIEFVPGTRLAGLYRDVAARTVNSVHHQGIRDLAKEFTVEARSPTDGIIEAFRWRGPSYVAGVQWHPEFHDWRDATLLPGEPLLNDFLEAVDAGRSNHAARISDPALRDKALQGETHARPETQPTGRP